VEQCRHAFSPICRLRRASGVRGVDDPRNGRCSRTAQTDLFSASRGDRATVARVAPPADGRGRTRRMRGADHRRDWALLYARCSRTTFPGGVPVRSSRLPTSWTWYSTAFSATPNGSGGGRPKRAAPEDPPSTDWATHRHDTTRNHTMRSFGLRRWTILVVLGVCAAPYGCTRARRARRPPRRPRSSWPRPSPGSHGLRGIHRAHRGHQDGHGSGARHGYLDKVRSPKGASPAGRAAVRDRPAHLQGRLRPGRCQPQPGPRAPAPSGARPQTGREPAADQVVSQETMTG